MIAPRKPREAGNVKHHILFRVNIQYFQCRVHPVSNCYPFGKYGPFCGGYLPKKGESLVAFSRFGSMVRMEKMGSLTPALTSMAWTRAPDGHRKHPKALLGSELSAEGSNPSSRPRLRFKDLQERGEKWHRCSTLGDLLHHGIPGKGQ
ncbi:hypothetical protein RRG08_003855 [Elysia crispata]|uniref:Uncharacterized protein n=1 Tax=Elysia crispata TaxID=231223 RepID=A0AAE1DED5_9GAST|nr:hypothetical protein RRG08_003855 [Elysia crispata]